jgi:uncharacterized protein (TIGR02996 family)
MNPTQQAILQAILDEPDDDTHRLVYADWLEDNGENDRAEFIRLQIMLWNAERDCNCGSKRGGHQFTGGQHHNGPCEADQLRIKINGVWKQAWLASAEILIKYGSSFFSDIAQLFSGNLVWSRRTLTIFDSEGALAEFTIQRGFLHTIRIKHDEWITHAKAICLKHPIQRVELTDKETYSGMNGKFRWVNDDHARTIGSGLTTPQYWQAYLNKSIFDLLAGYRSPNQWLDEWCEYETKEEAINDLSNACIKYGRAK